MSTLLNMYPGEQPRLGETEAQEGGYVLPDLVHCTSGRIKGQEYVWSWKAMNVFVGERTYTRTCDQAYIERHDEQQADTARTTSVPACDSIPNILMYFSMNGHITFGFPGNYTQHPDLPISPASRGAAVKQQDIPTQTHIPPTLFFLRAIRIPREIYIYTITSIQVT